MSLDTAFEVTLEFLSDWHIGTGQGRLGTIDAEVRRDADGLPFVPAKTLVGVWRDACETVAGTFDRAADRPGAWLAWVIWIFGSQGGKNPTTGTGQQPTPAALRLTPARVPAWLGAAVRDRSALTQAAVVLRPGVTIDDVTGTAADRLLRVEERGIRGTRLTSRVSFDPAGGEDGTGKLPPPAELLLRAGARLIEAVGGKRNRGSGRVAVLLPGSSVDTAASHPTVTDSTLAALLATGVPATPPPPPAPQQTIQVYPYDRLRPDRRRTVRLVLQVVTPVVATHDVLGNVIIGRDAVPGTALLGTILARAEAEGPDGAHRDAIGLRDLGVGDAVPAVGDPQDPASVTPARPVPVVWHRGDKGRGSIVHNTLTAEQVSDDRAKPMSGWVARSGDGWRHVEPTMEVSTHAVVDDEARRPTVASGGVYTYIGIAPGTLLCSDIVLPAGVRLRLSKGERLRFGRSRKDDFGLVDVVALVDPLPEPMEPASAADPKLLRVWCISDVLLRDKRLAPDPSPTALARALSDALAPASFDVLDKGTVSAANRREGFGVAWGRPRPSQVPLRAGSVISLSVTGLVDSGRLAELERDGVGERTVEGYGRIRFNPLELSVDRPMVDFAGGEESDPDDGPSDSIDDPGRAADLDEPVHLLEVNAWRQVIRRASADLPPDKLVPGISRMTGNRAQLGALRTQLERLALPGGRDLVRHWIEATRAVRARRETWTEPVLKELAELLLDDQERIWCRLGLAGEQPGLVLGPGRADAIRQQLRTEALTVAVTDALRHLTRAAGDHANSEVSATGSATAEEER